MTKKYISQAEVFLDNVKQKNKAKRSENYQLWWDKSYKFVSNNRELIDTDMPNNSYQYYDLEDNG